MEQIIAKLLQEFEEGKISRRQLIQGLALTATGAASLVGVPSASANGSAFKAVGVNHMSIDVADHNKVRDFYVDLFGMKTWGEGTKTDRPPQIHLKCGETYITLRDRKSNTPRVEHIAIAIEKFDKKMIEAELQRRGIQADWDSGGTANVKDPEGFHIQIVPKNFTTI